MKREILFKAKRIDNGEWIEGVLAYFFDNKETPYIMPKCYFATREMGEDENDETIISDEICFGGFISVNPDTVCQFTGLTDKNGNKIFEGDICRFESIPVLGGKSLEVTIEFEDGSFWGWEESIIPNECEIIGNIHD
jgi:uncharacterized phage protein (TIGR01671 family)